MFKNSNCTDLLTAIIISLQTLPPKSAVKTPVREHFDTDAMRYYAGVTHRSVISLIHDSARTVVVDRNPVGPLCYRPGLKISGAIDSRARARARERKHIVF